MTIQFEYTSFADRVPIPVVRSVQTGRLLRPTAGPPRLPPCMYRSDCDLAPARPPGTTGPRPGERPSWPRADTRLRLPRVINFCPAHRITDALPGTLPGFRA